MSTYANIKMTTDNKTVELNEIQCELADLLYTYITEKLQQKFQLCKTYQLNPVELCKFINETNDVETGIIVCGFTEDSELYYQSHYFFGNRNPEEEMKAFQNNQYLFGQYINETTKLEISFD